MYSVGLLQGLNGICGTFWETNVKADSAPLVRIACTAHAVQAYRLSELCI